MGVLEDIKKEIKKTFYIDEDDMHFEKANINIDSLFEILDKYKDKECKYKNAWNNLKRTFITETLLGKILYKFIISTLNILLKICNETDKIRRTLWK